jgi:hypothetical protein
MTKSIKDAKGNQDNLWRLNSFDCKPTNYLYVKRTDKK